jgi:hypothetical protein
MGMGHWWTEDWQGKLKYSKKNLSFVHDIAYSLIALGLNPPLLQ